MSLTQALTFPWFLLRLSLVVSPTLLRFAAIPARKYLHLILALAFLIIVVALHLWKSGVLFPYSRSIPPTAITAEARLDQEIQYWENLHQLQPTHRDILVNLVALYQLKGDEAKATYYLEQARRLDPNNPLFQ